MNKRTLAACTDAVEKVLDRLNWRVAEMAPLLSNGADGYDGSADGVRVVVAGWEEDLADGTATVPDPDTGYPVVLRLPPHLAQRALQAARAATVKQ